MIITGKFPALRLRRNRKFEWTRRLIQESSLSPNDLILPIFLTDGKNKIQPIKTMPGIKRYTIDNSQRIKHNALLDCDLLAKVYINLIDQKEPTLNFQNHISEISNEKNKSLSYFKKIIVPNDEELIKHEQYLKNFLKKNNF